MRVFVHQELSISKSIASSLILAHADEIVVWVVFCAYFLASYLIFVLMCATSMRMVLLNLELPLSCRALNSISSSIGIVRRRSQNGNSKISQASTGLQIQLAASSVNLPFLAELRLHESHHARIAGGFLKGPVASQNIPQVLVISCFDYDCHTPQCEGKVPCLP